MLGWLLLGIARDVAIGAAVATVVAVAVTICVKYLNKNTAKQELRNKNIKKATVKDIVTSGSITHISLDALTEDGDEEEVDIQTEGYNSNEIRKGVTIYA